MDQSNSSRQRQGKGGRSLSGITPIGGITGGAAVGGNEAKLKQLSLKKERLSYAVERLTLQAQHRERQLRKSMAAQ